MVTKRCEQEGDQSLPGEGKKWQQINRADFQSAAEVAERMDASVFRPRAERLHEEQRFVTGPVSLCRICDLCYEMTGLKFDRGCK
jgi:hypothetical protein